MPPLPFPHRIAFLAPALTLPDGQTGALGRRSVGTTIVGGMLLSTMLNLIFIPVLYVILRRLLSSGKEEIAPAAQA